MVDSIEGKKLSKRYRERIIKRIGDVASIRNVSIIAHIDHGKTTLADHFLTAGFLISEKTAGIARALDYLEEEQRRGITIKNSLVSFIYNAEREYLINVVDTPGHIDFNYQVSQALRLVDGVIVVVDIVEGIMAQTRNNLNLAIEEGIQPILVINKIDRMISELRLTVTEVEKKMSYLVDQINIQIRAKQKISGIKEVSFERGSVIIGSAKDGWMVSYNEEEGKKIHFKTILESYNQGKKSELRRRFPAGNVVLNAISRVIQPPYRRNLEKREIWLSREHFSKFIAMDGEKLAAYVGKNELHEEIIVSIVRIFSGCIHEKEVTSVWRDGNQEEIKIHRIQIAQGNKNFTVPKACTGMIIILKTDKKILPGEIITAGDQIKGIKPMTISQEPVMKVTIEPKKTDQVEKLQKYLKKHSSTDAGMIWNTNRDTGEIIVSTVGELQLEILISSIEKYGIEIFKSEPLTVTMEEIAEGKECQYKLDKVQFKGYSDNTENVNKVKQFMNRSYSDERGNVLLVSQTNLKEGVEHSIKSAFRIIIKQGPMYRAPLRNLTIIIDEINIKENLSEDEAFQGALEFFSALLKASKFFLAEPSFLLNLTTPSKYFGKVQSLLRKRKGQIDNTTYNGDSVQINGQILVRNIWGFASEVRRITEGYVFFDLELDKRYKEIKED